MKNRNLTQSTIVADLELVQRYKSIQIKECFKDSDFALGVQWDSETLEAMEKRKVRPITINKIMPMIRLITGIESQNRSSYSAFAIGKEDEVKGEIVTRLLTYFMDKTDGDNIVSDTFKDGLITGECYLEPYMVTGASWLKEELKLSRVPFNKLFVDPDSKEYDLSDAKYIIKITKSLTKDQLFQIFPKKSHQSKIEKTLSEGSLAPSNFTERGSVLNPNKQDNSYFNYDESQEEHKEPRYDLIEYYYKKYIPEYAVIHPYIDQQTGEVFYTVSEVFLNDEDILNKISLQQKVEAQAKKLDQIRVDSNLSEAYRVKVKKRIVPEVWKASTLMGLESPIEDVKCEFSPKWKNYPFIPFFAFKTEIPANAVNRGYRIQGLPRQIRDLNIELNKRRTQELVHLNQSVNSGYTAFEGSLLNPEDWERFSSAPGVIKWIKRGENPPIKDTPTPLSQGHAQLAVEISTDIKEVSGINSDLLAAQAGGTDSGVAINLRQKQGMVMLQGYFDNLARMKKIFAKFIVSQFSNLIDVENAMDILGQKFLQENFTEQAIGEDGQPLFEQIPNPETGEILQGAPVMVYSEKKALAEISDIIDGTKVGEYDVKIGQSVGSDTVRRTNFLLLQQLLSNNIPIPPEVMLDESELSEATKKKVLQSIKQ